MRIGFMSGVRYFLQGMGYLLRPGLRRFVLLPIIINAILVGGLSFTLYQGVQHGVTVGLNYLPDWLSWLYWLVVPLLIALVVFLFAYFFSTLLMVLMAPLNGLLSEKVDRLAGIGLPQESVGRLIRRTFARETVKLGYLVPRYFGLFVISLIPVVNSLSPLLWILFASWVIALQYADYSFDNRQLTFAQTKQCMRQRWAQSLGFGAVVMVLFAIPIVNWVVMPAAVIGATLMHQQSHSALSKEG